MPDWTLSHRNQDRADSPYSSCSHEVRTLLQGAESALWPGSRAVSCRFSAAPKAAAASLSAAAVSQSHLDHCLLLCQDQENKPIYQWNRLLRGAENALRYRRRIRKRLELPILRHSRSSSSLVEH
jgi:hypothetical protein